MRGVFSTLFGGRRWLNQILKSAKFWNFNFLIGGFVLGQGSIFLTQTWLVTRGDFEIMAMFGTNFSATVLLTLITDFGYSITLAREAVNSRDFSGENESYMRAYWSACYSRFVVAIILSALVIGWVMTSGKGFSFSYQVAAIPGILAWAFNSAGILDGLRLSGVSGFASIFPYLFAALSLFVAASIGRSSDVGWMVGTSVSAGYILAVIVQNLVLIRLGCMRRPSFEGFAVMWRRSNASFAVLAAILPGQLFFRLQLLICLNLLGSTATALLVYAKQIATGFNLIVQAVRRVEFPDLVKALRDPAMQNVQSILNRQKIALGIGFCCTMIMVVAALAAAITAETSDIYSSAVAVGIFAPTVLSASVYLSLVQGLHALGEYKIAARFSLFAIGAAVVFTLTLTKYLGLLTFAAAEIFLAIIVFVLALRHLRRRMQ